MFTIQQIKNAHSKVKSGADFPQYMQDIIKLGVISFQTYVSDGHTDYAGENNFTISSPASHSEINIAVESNEQQFKSDLKAHQAGKTYYLTFCKDCAKSGIEKWEVLADAMTCTYFDLAGNEILVELIPVPKG